MLLRIVVAALLMGCSAAEAVRGDAAHPQTLRPLFLSPQTFRSPAGGDVTAMTDGGWTERQDIRLAAAARGLRVSLSNEFGDDALAIDHVRVTSVRPDGTTEGTTDIRFNGKAAAEIAPGTKLVSDLVDIALPAFSEVAVTVFYPHRPGQVARRPKVRSAIGGKLPTGPLEPGLAIVSALETPLTDCGRVVVAVGDSITEGYGAAPHHDWPSVFGTLSARTKCAPTVVNAGISGNQILRAGGSPSLLARFDRDVLAVPGVTDLVLLEGINDIRAWDTATVAEGADAIIAAYRQIVERAHAHGIRVYGATLLPFKGDAKYNDARASAVATINARIRQGAIFDGVVDFANALADPADPERMRADLQRGDWLHPNDEGYAKMAEAVQRRWFSPVR